MGSESRLATVSYSTTIARSGPDRTPSEGGCRETVYLCLGSNLGDRLANLEFAVERIAAICEIVAVSPIYETAYVGPEHGPQPMFLNCVIKAVTPLQPRALLEWTTAVEKDRDKHPTEHWRPRTLDIDILLYGSEVINEPDLQIPHPRMWDRAFVLAPLSDLEPAMLCPDGEPIHAMAKRLMQNGQHVELARCGIRRVSDRPFPASMSSAGI